VQEGSGQVDHTVGAIDVGGLSDGDLLATQGLSDDVQTAR
jgi:hypothetical protein